MVSRTPALVAVVFTLGFSFNAVAASTQTGSDRPPMTKEKQSNAKQQSKATQQSSGNSSPNVIQGPGSIAQIGNNNRATIVSGGRVFVSSEQGARITALLRPFAGEKLNLLVVAESSIHDASVVLENAIRSAGIAVEASDILGSFSWPAGFSMVAAPSKRGNALSNAIADALVGSGLVKGPIPVQIGDSESPTVLLRFAPF